MPRLSAVGIPVVYGGEDVNSQGLGSIFYEGRWHNKNSNQVVYCGSSRALCQLEKRVHTSGRAIKNQILVRLDLPKNASLIEVAQIGLPTDWLFDVPATRLIGDQWLRDHTSLGLWVPSAIEPLENNLLLNPMHPEYRSIKLTVERNPLEFDLRLF
jgi:RES domain-containing protein